MRQNRHFCHICGREIEEGNASIASIHVIPGNSEKYQRMLAPVCERCKPANFENINPDFRKTWIVDAFMPLVSFGGLLQMQGEWK